MNDKHGPDSSSSPATAAEKPGLLDRLRIRRARSQEERGALRLPPMGRGSQLFALVLFFLGGVALTAFVLLDPLGLGWLPGARTPGTGPAIAAPSSGLYGCPMHPEVVESTAADCPICGMKLTPLSDNAGPSAAKQQLYGCPMHPEVVESTAADCPICGMKLTPLSDNAGPSAAKQQLYGCPMHPEVVEPDEGDCPICGMRLVPLESEEATPASKGRIHIDPVQIQNIGVVSVHARTGDIARTVRTVGILDFNADRITWINTKFSGWIEKVHVTYVGQEVSRGDPLFDVYSPELVTTQEEYLRALAYAASLEHGEREEASSQARSLLDATRQRMRYWDIGDDQILALERSREVQRQLTVRSPANGVVAAVMDESLEGMFIEAGMNLYKIADLSSLWVHADVFESDLPWVKQGQPATVSFRNDPERVYEGKILFLYPEVSRETRTLKICVEVPNPRNRLRAGMYSDVTLHGPKLRGAVLIPDSAVLRSGTRDLVFVDLGDGSFEPRAVELGIPAEDGLVQVRRGVADGEAVVTQAQFMLDSESRVQEAIGKFRERGRARARDQTSHDHGG